MPPLHEIPSHSTPSSADIVDLTRSSSPEYGAPAETPAAATQSEQTRFLPDEGRQYRSMPDNAMCLEHSEVWHAVDIERELTG